MNTVNGSSKDIQVVAVAGRVDALTSYDLQNRLLELVTAGKHFIAIDLSALEYISSAGLRSLMVAARMIVMRKGFIGLFGQNESISKIFDTVNFASLINIYPDRQAAIAAASEAIAASPGYEPEREWPGETLIKK